jgi:hypothetical protein
LALGTEKHLANELLCREPNKKLSAQKKHSPKISLPRANWLALDKVFLCQVQFSDSRQRKLKKITFCLQFFLSSTYTYTKLMLKFGTISALFAIFKIFTSL